MANFLELSFSNDVTKTKLVNIDSISFIECWSDGSVSINLVGNNEVLKPNESYDWIKSKIKELAI